MFQEESIIYAIYSYELYLFRTTLIRYYVWSWEYGTHTYHWLPAWVYTVLIRSYCQTIGMSTKQNLQICLVHIYLHRNTEKSSSCMNLILSLVPSVLRLELSLTVHIMVWLYSCVPIWSGVGNVWIPIWSDCIPVVVYPYGLVYVMSEYPYGLTVELGTYMVCYM